MWSSIQPDPGTYRSGWLRKKRKRPPGRRTRPTSAMAASTPSMCSKTRQARAASNAPSGKGSATASPLTNDAPPARRCASTSWPHDGSTPTTRAPAPAATRANWPSPVPTSSTDVAPARCSAARGMICSVYSASAPPVNASCHQPAWVSQSERSEMASVICTSRLMEFLMDVDRHRVRQPGQGDELGQRRLLHRGHAAQLLDQPLLPRRPEAGDVVDAALDHALAPELAVVVDGEAVSLVPQALQQVERLGLAGDP